MLESYLVQTCKLVAPTRDEYGDYIDGVGTELACRFREINTITRGTRNETNDSIRFLMYRDMDRIIVEEAPVVEKKKTTKKSKK